PVAAVARPAAEAAPRWPSWHNRRAARPRQPWPPRRGVATARATSWKPPFTQCGCHEQRRAIARETRGPRRRLCLATSRLELPRRTIVEVGDIQRERATSVRRE